MSLLSFCASWEDRNCSSQQLFPLKLNLTQHKRCKQLACLELTKSTSIFTPHLLITVHGNSSPQVTEHQYIRLVFLHILDRWRRSISHTDTHGSLHINYMALWVVLKFLCNTTVQIVWLFWNSAKQTLRCSKRAYIAIDPILSDCLMTFLPKPPNINTGRQVAEISCADRFTDSSENNALGMVMWIQP